MMDKFPELNVPVSPTFRWKWIDGRPMFWDAKRKKYLLMTPEEWVRQHIIAWLESEGYPPSLIAVERKLTVNKLTKRFDIVVFDRKNKPYLLVECKRPDVKLSEDVFHQTIVYNVALKAPFLMMTNGINHIIISQQEYVLLQIKDLPPFGL